MLEVIPWLLCWARMNCSTEEIILEEQAIAVNVNTTEHLVMHQSSIFFHLHHFPSSTFEATSTSLRTRRRSGEDTELYTT